MRYLKIMMIGLVCIICFGQAHFKDIDIPHCGPYFKQWEEKAKQGDPLAMLDLYEWTEGIYNANTDLPLPPVSVCVRWQADAEKIIHQKVKELADKGNVDAMKSMGYFAIEDPTAKDYLHKAVELGDPYAILNYAMTLKYDSAEQNKLFKKYENIVLERAQKGDRRAMVAVVCESDSIPPKVVNDIFNQAVSKKDFYAGVIYYLKARRAINISASFDSDQERVKAIMRWLEKSAQCGEIRAMEELSQLYYHGEDNASSGKFPKNLERAWYWARAYRKAVGCPSPDVDPPVDENGKPWKRPQGRGL